MITVTFDAEKLIGNEWILNPVAVLSTPDQTEEKTVCIQFGWLKWLLTIAVAYKGKAKIG